jgi:hypothetical protein
MLVEMDLNDPGPIQTPATIAFSDPDVPDTTAASASTLVTASWTPPTSGLIILLVGSQLNPTPNVPTVSGNSLTWVQIATIATTNLQRLTLFGANATGSTTGTTTVSFGGQTQNYLRAGFMAATGVDLVGGVAAAFVQAPTVAAIGTSGAVTLAAAANSANRPISAWLANAVSYTPGTNWTEADDMGDTNLSMETQYRSDAFDTSATVTWGGASRNYVGIAAELKVGSTTGFTSPTWAADLTTYVRAWSTNRGSQRELQRVEAGTASITLDNRDGRFTPMSSTSTYYPDLLPMRRVRIQAIWNAVTYPIFSGFVELWPVSFPEVGKDQIVTLSLVDGFKVLSLSAVSGSFSQQLSGARVNAILDDIGWPAADRDIDTGLSTIPAATLTNESALTHLQAVEHAETGRLFMTRDGKVTFVQRGTSAAPDFTGRTWADDGTGMSYRDLTLAFGDELIINDARLTRTGGSEQVATSATSIAEYFTRSFIESGILLTTDAAVSDLAAGLVTTYSEPALRIEGLADNALRHGQWDNLLTRELKDRVLVVKTPAGGGTLSQDSFIERIAHSWVPAEWRTTLGVSPVFAAAQWLLDDATLSILDTSTILSW